MAERRQEGRRLTMDLDNGTTIPLLCFSRVERVVSLESSPESAATMETTVDDFLEDVLENHVQSSAEYISTLMPSRQAQRLGYSYSTLRHTIGRRRKRTSSYHHWTQDSGRPGSEADAASRIDLLQGTAGEMEVGEDDGPDERDRLMQIRSMSAPMRCKRKEWEKVRNKVVISPGTAFLQNWMKRKFEYIRENIGSAFSNIYFWRNSIHNIEGYYGTGVAAVFVFLQWLMLLNILMMVLVLVFVVVPQALHLNSPGTNTTVELSRHPVATISCPSNSSLNQTDDMFSEFQDLLQGTGWMEWTEMFYGFYSYNLTEAAHEVTEALTTYNLSLAYLLVTIFYFAICLILMLRSAARGTRENLFTSTAKVNQFCNVVFVGWDFCIRKKRTAAIRTELIHNELKSLVEEVNLEEEKLRRSRREKYSIFARRGLVNVTVACILAGCGVLIFYVVKGTQMVVGDGTPTKNNLLTLLIEFSPSITITVLNVIVPLLFEYLIKYERYISPATTISMTMVRTVLLRLSAIAVLLGTLYTGIHGSDPSCLHCWETYVGQQIYKLAVMDFVFGIFIPFVVHFPRKLIVTHFPNKVTNWIGLQPFDIPTHTLDIVYCQALCWMGTFYCPLLPVLTIVKCLAFFYVKKFSLFFNCEQSRVTFRVSKSSNLFIIVLILSYILAIIPVAFSIGRLTPSDDCGPFIGLKYMWDVIGLSMSNWPAAGQNFVRFFGTAGFAIPALIGLLLLIYYYVTVAAAHKHELSLLQDQLVIEGRDKQFLLKRLQSVMEVLKAAQSTSSHLAAS